MAENSNLLLFLLLVIFITRLSNLLKKIGQPSLLGELGFGIIIALLSFYNIKFFQGLTTSATVAFFSELGAIFLLFEIGLESNIHLLKQNGSYAFIIAISGAILPFVSGYWFASYFVTDASKNFCLFFAATLAATSTGIAVRMFKEYNLINSKSCQIVLTASVIDDIISLITLTCITTIVTTGNFDISNLVIILIKIIVFLIFLYLAIKKIFKYFVDINKKDDSLNISIIIFICISASWLAHMVGLSSIIGAFLAGLFIDKNYFSNKHHLIFAFIWIFVPIFFIYSGMQININSLLNFGTLKFALLLSIIAIITKIIPPLFIPSKTNFLDRIAIGVGMVPRGEIGLIIALIGKEIKVLNDYYFSIITLMVIITSFISPILLNQVLKKMEIKNK